MQCFACIAPFVIQYLWLHARVCDQCMHVDAQVKHTRARQFHTWQSIKHENEEWAVKFCSPLVRCWPKICLHHFVPKSEKSSLFEEHSLSKLDLLERVTYFCARVLGVLMTHSCVALSNVAVVCISTALLPKPSSVSPKQPMSSNVSIPGTKTSKQWCCETSRT